MKTRQIKAIVHLCLAGICLLLGTAANAAKPAKTLVCHAPPGNPDNIQIIEVGSDNAVMKHLLEHGDWKVTGATCDTIMDNDCDGMPDDTADTDADCDDDDTGTTDSCNTDIGECVNEPTEVACPCEADYQAAIDQWNNTYPMNSPYYCQSNAGVYPARSFRSAGRRINLTLNLFYDAATPSSHHCQIKSRGLTPRPDGTTDHILSAAEVEACTAVVLQDCP